MMFVMPSSSSGLGHSPLKAETGVRSSVGALLYHNNTYVIWLNTPSKLSKLKRDTIHQMEAPQNFFEKFWNIKALLWVRFVAFPSGGYGY